MKKTFAGIVFLIAVCWAACCHADDSQTATINLRGDVHTVCSIQPAQATTAANMSLMQASAALNTVTITKLIDSNTAQLLPASISLKFKALCNFPHSIFLKTINGGMRGGGNVVDPDSPFQNFLNYTVKLRWGSIYSELTTDGTQGQRTPTAVENGAYFGDLTLDITLNQNTAGSRKVLGDNYKDVLVITLGAAL